MIVCDWLSFPLLLPSVEEVVRPETNFGKRLHRGVAGERGAQLMPIS